MKVKIQNTFGEVINEVEVNSSSPMLEQLESSGIVMQSACHHGACGVCAIKLISGKENIDPSSLEEAVGHHGDDELLPCVARVKAGEGEIVIQQR